MQKSMLVLFGLICMGIMCVANAYPSLQGAFISNPSANNAALIVNFQNDLIGSGTVDLNSVDIRFYTGAATGGSVCTGIDLGEAVLSGNIAISSAALPEQYGFEKAAAYQTADQTVGNPALISCVMIEAFHGTLGSSNVHSEPAKAYPILCSIVTKKCSYVDEIDSRDMYLEETS